MHTNRDEALKIMSKAQGMSKKEMNTGIAGVCQHDLKRNIEAMQKLALSTARSSVDW